MGQGQAGSWYTLPDGSDRKMYAGQDRWIAIRLLIPASYVSGRWNSITQFKGQGIGNGPMSWRYFDERQNHTSPRACRKRTAASTDAAGLD